VGGRTLLGEGPCGRKDPEGGRTLLEKGPCGRKDSVAGRRKNLYGRKKHVG